LQFHRLFQRNNPEPGSHLRALEPAGFGVVGGGRQLYMARMWGADMAEEENLRNFRAKIHNVIYWGLQAAQIFP
jgi:hypothetical protein